MAGPACEAAAAASATCRCSSEGAFALNKRLPPALKTALTPAARLASRFVHLDAADDRRLASKLMSRSRVTQERLQHVVDRLARIEAALAQQAEALQRLTRPESPAHEDISAAAQPEAEGKPKRRLKYQPLDGFKEAARPALEHKRTMMGPDRLYVLWQAVQNVHRLGLPVVEVGSFRGGSAYFLATAFRQASGEEATIHIFDTFEGHPPQKISEHDPFHHEGMFSDTNYEDVKRYLAHFSKLHIHKGEFSSASVDLEEQQYSMVHIDTDLYEPTLDCLRYFAGRLATGGIIVIDDYASRKCPGVMRAAHEYLAGTNDFQVWDVQTEQLVLVKSLVG
jgi:O-methyltransferase